MLPSGRLSGLIMLQPNSSEFEPVMLITARLSCASRLALTVGTFLIAGTGASLAASVDQLIGSWGGAGTYTLNDGTREKLRCDAYYTGSSAQLNMVIRCTGATNKIEIRSKLNTRGDTLSGTWEERTYNAEGTVSGQVRGNKLSFSIQGGVAGTMSVSYSGSSQTVSISTQGIPLKSVSVSLKRR